MGIYAEYKSSLLPCTLQSMGYRIEWSKPCDADILIYGSFWKEKNNLRWLPRKWRPPVKEIINNGWRTRKVPPITIFHTSECLRYNHIKADFSISHDYGVAQDSHLRVPYWMEQVDWSHEGVKGNQNQRFGRLLSLSLLAQPLGQNFLSRPQSAALFASHMGEPRYQLMETLKKHLPVDGYGPYFDSSITHHNESPLQKADILKSYAFNFCPENNLFPGYYTEKIPEAFAAGCLPITWADPNIAIDFNPNSMVNMQTMVATNFEELKELLFNKQKLIKYADQPLLLKKHSIEPLKSFLRNIAGLVS